jgi:hypothetical protein
LIEAAFFFFRTPRGMRATRRESSELLPLLAERRTEFSRQIRFSNPHGELGLERQA